MGEKEANRTPKYGNSKENGFKAAPLERSKYSNPGNKSDPYVVRAMQRAQTKIKSCIFQINGRHVN